MNSSQPKITQPAAILEGWADDRIDRAVLDAKNQLLPVVLADPRWPTAIGRAVGQELTSALPAAIRQVKNDLLLPALDDPRWQKNVGQAAGEGAAQVLRPWVAILALSAGVATAAYVYRTLKGKSS